MIEILAAGSRATIQDAGRPGFAHLGVSRSGAADPEAFALANRLVGNAPGAAAVELTLGGLAVRFLDAATIALTGARCQGADWNAAFTVWTGTALRLMPPSAGLRSYLAVRGGIDVATVLGSRSTDTLSGLGPPRLQVGDLLPVGRDAPGEVGAVEAVPAARPDRVRVLSGPRDDWFGPDALSLLGSVSWTVGPDSNRIGIRLGGPPLPRRDGELASEPVIPGSVQVPPDGRPILLGPDAPVSGGYPVIAVALSHDLGVAAQLRPGDSLRFSVLTPAAQSSRSARSARSAQSSE